MLDETPWFVELLFLVALTAGFAAGFGLIPVSAAATSAVLFVLVATVDRVNARRRAEREAKPLTREQWAAEKRQRERYWRLMNGDVDPQRTTDEEADSAEHEPDGGATS